MRPTVLFFVLALAAAPAFQQPMNGSANATHGSARQRPTIASQVGTGENILTHLADGQGWKTRITIINLSQIKSANYSVNFYGNAGNNQSFFFEGIGDNVNVRGTLNPGGSTMLATTGEGTFSEGWAQFDSSTSPYVTAFAVFSNRNGNEAAVPTDSKLAGNQILPFDNTGGYGMGVALANSSSQAVTIAATFRQRMGAYWGLTVSRWTP